MSKAPSFVSRTDQHDVLEVQHVFKSYGPKSKPNQVLNNFNMTVTEGTIYCLLGASGCGKTTLLSCIFGRKRINSGEILVFGGKPGSSISGIPGKRVGYMPQKISLCEELSVKETMMYFGWIFGMQTREINDRIASLLKFFDLPPERRLMRSLSCGQKRRVSFAVAILHDPELVVLDEPTVGIDIFQRKHIWNHLVKLTKIGRKTVIVTTSNIEEARQANKVGFMRAGQLLAEESPKKLLTKYQSASLEEVFIKLAQKQGETPRESDSSTNPGLKNKKHEDDHHYKPKDELVIIETSEASYRLNGRPSLIIESSDESLIEKTNGCGTCSSFTSRGKMRALLYKNFLRIWRNVSLMVGILLLPLLQVILFYLSVGRDPSELKLAIVNKEMVFESHGCPFKMGCTLSNLSCRYLSQLSPRIIQENFNDFESARHSVKEGNYHGMLFINENFTKNLVTRLISKKEADVDKLNMPQIQVWLDMSNQQVGSFIQRELLYSFQQFLRKLLKDCDQNPTRGDALIHFEDPIYGSYQSAFTDFVAPGMIMTTVFLMAVAFSSSALITERIKGILNRSWVAGVSSTETLLSHLIAQLVIMCVQTLLVLLCVIFVCGTSINGNIILVIVMTILCGMCGMCFGFLISAVCELERTAVYFALGSFYPTLMLSGVLWPIEGMPWLLRKLTVVLPLMLPTSALRSILTRGWDVSEPEVYLGFVAIVVWIFIFYAITVIAMKIKRN